MAASRVFVDTNVLVYANWTGARRHGEARQRIEALAEADSGLCVSRQVLREFLAVVTRPQGDVIPMSTGEAWTTVKALDDLFDVLEGGASSFARLLDLVALHEVKGRMIHDANIVATMSVHGVRRLLTANPADFRRFADIIDIEPL
jgi:predicted nucleic acid-binding protein